jgi:undecaprenyl pyrophosphate synthase
MMFKSSMILLTLTMTLMAGDLVDIPRNKVVDKTKDAFQELVETITETEINNVTVEDHSIELWNATKTKLIQLIESTKAKAHKATQPKVKNDSIQI